MEVRKIVGLVIGTIVLIVAGYALGQEDGAELTKAAREALNRAQYEKAAQLLSEAYQLQKETEEAGNALYWEAFARYRLQRDAERKRAIELLRLQQEKYAMAETAHEGEALLARLYAEMAERGEIEAIREIERISEEEIQREETRIQALHALMNMNPEKAMPILEKIVRDEANTSAELRRNALFVLCRGDNEQTEDLLIDLARTTTDPEMLSEIVMCLSMSGSEQALDAVVTLFEQSEDGEVSDEALFAIGRHGGDRAFTILSDVARDNSRDSDVRAQALFGLAQTGRDEQVAEIVTELLRTSDDQEILEASLFALSQLEGSVPDQVLLELVNNPQANDDMRAQALFFVAQRSDLSLDFLLSVYEQAEDEQLKLQVCHVISQTQDDDEALDALIRIARAEDSLEIKQNMLHWIGQYDNEKAADYLLEVITQD